MKTTKAFYVDGSRCCCEYSCLVGPDDFECVLTEPEDRSWTRDGRDVVDLLNKQYEEIQELKRLLGDR